MKHEVRTLHGEPLGRLPLVFQTQFLRAGRDEECSKVESERESTAIEGAAKVGGRGRHNYAPSITRIFRIRSIHG